MKIVKPLSLLSIIALSITACKKDNSDVTKPTDINEGELITTVQFNITDADSPFTKQVFEYKDVDGIGGNAPLIDTIKLNNNKFYTVEIILLDESKNPIDTISNEVLEEANDHMLVFEPASSQISVTINDFDTNNPPLPLGLLSSWATTTAGNTSIKVSLKHQPGIKNGDPTRGETDVEVVIPVVVE